MLRTEVVGRLIRSLPLTRPFGLAVYVAQAPAGSVL